MLKGMISQASLLYIMSSSLKPAAHGEENAQQFGMNVTLLRKNSRRVRMIFAEEILICVAKENIYHV